MGKHDQPFHLCVTLPTLVVITIGLGIVFSYLGNDPHWLNRAGALIAAIAAVAILVQIGADLDHRRPAWHRGEDREGPPRAHDAQDAGGLAR